MDSNHGSSDSDRFYGEFYERVNWTKGIGAFAVRGMHRKMEKEYANGHFETCLELGGGSGQHLDYVLHGFNSYVLVDLREAQLSLKWASDPRIRSVTGDAENIPFHDKYFDRVIITCLLHHVDNPEKVLQEVDRVLKIGGVATIFFAMRPWFASSAYTSPYDAATCQKTRVSRLQVVSCSRAQESCCFNRATSSTYISRPEAQV